jgi:glucose-1-phosphate thymidylyltransferase
MVEVTAKPLLTRYFEQLIELNAEEFIVVGYRKQDIISLESVPITYTHQREQNGIVHALLTIEEHIDDDFMFVFRDNAFRATLEIVADRQQGDCADATFLVEEVP